MRRVVITLGSIVLAAILLILLAAAFAILILWFAHLIGLERVLGIDTQQSKNYDFVSGSGPMFVTVLGFSGMIVTALHHLNCHQDGCLRIGRYPVAGGQYKTCRVHHPDPAVRSGVTADHLLAAHRRHEGV